MARKTTKPTTKKRTPRNTQETLQPRRSKPVFRAGTWFTLLLLAVLIGTTFYLNREKDFEDIDVDIVTSEIAFVFAEGKIVSSIEVKSADGRTVKVVRSAENVWALKVPDDVEADQGMVEAAASQVTALMIISEVDADPKILGLDKPAYVITIEFTDGEKHTLEVGENTPTNSGYYVRLDKKKTMIVALSGIDSLTSLAFFPPYLNTPTPTALPPTATPDLPTESVPTPKETVTPTP
jgi:hypothetical protein